MKRLLLMFALLTATFSVWAQPSMKGMNFNIGKVYGKILDKGTNKPLPYASIMIFQKFGQKDSLINGGLSEENGDFSVSGLPLQNLTVKISFLGYQDVSKTVKLAMPDDIELDMGNLAIEEAAIESKGVEITAEKAQVVMNIDKKVFNVSKNLASTGGTAEEVLKAVPSVTVDGDGNAQLRNNAATIYVDGKPTQLTLNQIPADMIEQVEVMTNPSAKYEAGMTGGLVNIVLKKNKTPGYNGFVSLGAATGNRYNGTLNLNLYRGKWNFSGFYNRNQSNFPVKGYTNRTNYDSLGNIESYFNQNSLSRFRNTMQIARVAIDYSVNNRNTLTLAGNYVNGSFNVGDNQVYQFLNANKDTTYTGSKTIAPDNHWNNYSVQATWKKQFPRKGHEWITDAMYSWGESANQSNWSTTRTPYGTPNTSTLNQVIWGGSKGYQLTFQSDMVQPLNDSTKIEYGIRSYFDGRAQNLFVSMSENKNDYDSTLSQDLLINMAINAAYVNYASKWRGIGYQVGLRYEQTDFWGSSVLPMDTTFGYHYPNYKAKDFKSMNLWKGLFPAIYLSHKFDEKNELQLNATRKLNRPGFMQILPVIFMADAQNIRRGNPTLQPEFINMVELNYNKLFGKSNWISSLYYRYEENPIVNSVQKMENGLLLNTFTNGKNISKYGWENTYKTTLGSSFDITANANVMRMRLVTADVDKSGWMGNGKLILNYRFPEATAIKIGGKPMIKWSAQWAGMYESRQIIPQGYMKAIPSMDFSIKAEAFKVANIVFSVNDITNTRRRVWVYDDPTQSYTQEQMRRRDTRYFKVALQIPFGKMDASVFKMQKNMKRMQQQNPNGGGGMDGY